VTPVLLVLLTIALNIALLPSSTVALFGVTTT
jgi:hypothetical protein